LRSRVNLNLFTTAPLYYTFSTQVTSNSWKIIIFVELSNKKPPMSIPHFCNSRTPATPELLLRSAFSDGLAKIGLLSSTRI
jgi:hypothetical protein